MNRCDRQFIVALLDFPERQVGDGCITTSVAFFHSGFTNGFPFLIADVNSADVREGLHAAPNEIAVLTKGVLNSLDGYVL
ncbi:MAG: hypothetical protein DDT34_02125 [Firmicutes bacterium]|nr:hypothetical protein [Bacillota bacterium]